MRWILLWALVLTQTAWAGIITGRVVNGTDSDSIVGATVKAAGRTAVSQTGGVFRLTRVPAGTHTVTASAPGHEPFSQSVVVEDNKATTLFIILYRPGETGDVIEITRKAVVEQTPPGKLELTRKELTRIPGTRGDALQSIRSLPGVANAGAIGNGPGDIVIRGAGPEDSKYVIDGVEVPLIYHFFGIQSIIPSEMIDKIDFYPGGFGVEEGRATGGIIDVSTRSEQSDKWGGFAELSFINFATFVKGPVSKKHNVYLTAGFRRSLIDLILPAVIPDDSDFSFTTAPKYYDGQLRVDWFPNKRHRFSSFSLFSFDLLSLLNDTVNPNEPELQGKWDNETSFWRAINSWRYEDGPVRNRLVLSAGQTGFRFEIGDENRFLRVRRDEAEVRNDYLYTLSPQLDLRLGGQLRWVRRDLEIRFPVPPAEGSGGGDNFSSAPLVELDTTLPDNAAGGYVAVDYKPTEKLLLSPGLRYDYFFHIDETTLHPRLNAQYQATDKLLLKGSAGMYSRPLSQAEGISRRVDPETANQYTLGAEYRVADRSTINITGFYTDRNDLLVQDARLAETDPANSYVNRGTGRSFGAEILARMQRDNFFGWFAYTLSRSDREDGDGSERRLFDYDQTHIFVGVASYTLGNWEFGSRWQYSTGSPLTPVLGGRYIADLNAFYPIYGEANSTRQEAGHQLDIRIDRKWKFDSWTLSAFLDITNVYANARILGYRYNFDFSEREAITELPILPAIGIRGEF